MPFLYIRRQGHNVSEHKDEIKNENEVNEPNEEVNEPAENEVNEPNEVNEINETPTPTPTPIIMDTTMSVSATTLTPTPTMQSSTSIMSPIALGNNGGKIFMDKVEVKGPFRFIPAILAQVAALLKRLI